MKWLTGLRRDWALAVAAALLGVSCSADRSTTVLVQPPSAPAPETVLQSQAPPTPKTQTTVYDPPPVPQPRRQRAAVDPFAGLSPQQADVARGLRDAEFVAYQQALTRAEIAEAEEPALESEDTALIDEINEEAIPDDFDISKTREERLRNTESELPLVLNAAVVRMVNYFTGTRGSRTLRATLGRSGAYRDMIQRVLEEEDVPAELFHLAQAESGFRPTVRSYASAKGMWQFMAFRGKQYDLRQDRYLDERDDPEKATRAAAQHLKDLYIEFGDWYLALAAYNSGPGRVSRAIESGGTRDYWELSRKRLLPRQTRDYIPIILAFTYASKNLDVYDVGEIDYAPPLRYDSVTTSSEISLDLAADLAGSSVTELRELNPALLRSATPPYAYQLRLPEGSAERFGTELALIPADERLKWRRHEIGEGETGASLAKQFGADEAELLAVNGLEAGAELEPGMRLTIPATNTKLTSYRSAGSAGGLLQDGSGRYRIANGDTLGGIARRFGVSVTQLRSWNGLPNNRIRAGRYLIVNANGGTSASAGAAPDGSYHVRSGDTLGKIAQRFGTTVSRLRAWNSLSSTRINVGQSLRVPSVGGSAASRSTRAGADRQATPSSGRYQIRSGDTLGAIADRFGVSITDLRNWNNIRGNRIIAGDTLVVGSGGSSSTSSATTTAAAPASGSAIRYRIRSGDNLAVIAKRHGVSIDDLRKWNGLRGSTIQAGKTLIVGYGSSASPAAATAASAPAPSSSGSGASTYVVRSGDTLGGIAERFGTTASDLRAWNGLRSSRINVGQRLTVKAPNSAANSGDRYKVRSGDTLEVIARRFNCTVAELKAWNALRSSRINAGDVLTVRAESSSNRGG
ncbi:MAG: LysM peptidoglycan-binding domain-containing protein [Acidobacteria bacterium]|nr:LysM peptidoglycan-binding domain-containing protein [Acidobacteriota bacterium]MDA1233301.1 LysM peptidoglycan-binding domain-containing protein [Acidobacteriota bacterium]